MTVGETLSFNIGQCGVQVGNACWTLYGSEQGIGVDGSLTDASFVSDFSFNSFYRQCSSGIYVPRTIYVDLEPTVIEEIKKGASGRLYHDGSLLYSHEDSANNFARGFYTCGKLLIKDVIFSTRKQVEACDSLTCFIVNHSYGGGTGSGFMSMLLEYLSAEFSKITKIDVGVIPNETLSCSSVEPYNAILGFHHPMETTDLSLLVENEPLYKLCQKKLSLKEPIFPNLNQLISQIMSGITCCTRFEAPLGCSLVDIQTNIVAYPRIHFPLVSFAPIGCAAATSRTGLSTSEITSFAFDNSHQLVSIRPNVGKIMAACLLYRGPVKNDDVFETLGRIKRSKTIDWVDWCPTGFKVGITNEPLLTPPQSVMKSPVRSVTLLKNTTAVKDVLGRLAEHFWSLYSRRSFIHWFVGEGMFEKEFEDAYEDVKLLTEDLEMLDKNDDELQAAGGEEIIAALSTKKGKTVEKKESKSKSTEQVDEDENNDNNEITLERNDTLTNDLDKLDYFEM